MIHERFLVTGAAGFIGSHFVHQLLAAYPKAQVVSYDCLTYASCYAALVDLEDHPRHHFVKGDIRNRSHIDATLAQFEIDAVVHFAAESHVDRSIANPEVFVETNVLGTFHLLEAARCYWQKRSWGSDQCRFHHVSTDEVYGALDLHQDAFTEQSLYQPNSPYSASKAGSDHLVRAYHHTYGLPVTLSNCSNNYGPYQHEEKLIPVVIKHCLLQQPVPIYGNGGHIRDWLYVKDHCDAVLAILQRGKPGSRYNIGGNHELTNLDLAHHLCKIMDQLKPASQPHASLITMVEDRKGHDFRYAINSQKIEKELHWSPAYTFESALSETVAFYCESLPLLRHPA